MATGARARIDELESLRGIAALLVVFFHIPKWHPALDLPLVDNAYLMVELFFVLSGFVIYGAYADRIRDAGALARFQFLRFARLYPVHLLFLLVFLGIEGAKALATARLGMAGGQDAPFAVNDARAFAENLFLVQALRPDPALTFNYPSWSISVEFWTYLVFGLLTLGLGARKDAGFALIALLSLALLAAGATGGMEPLLKCLGGFFLGALVARAMGRPRRLPLPPPAPMAALMLAFLMLKPAGRFDILIFPLAAALVAALVAVPAGPMARALRHRPLVRLGEVSYSLYMAHASVLWGANQAVRLWSDRPDAPDATGRMIPQLSLPGCLLAVALSLAVALALAVLVHAWVERPFRDWSRKVRPARGAVRPAG
ncbi:MAG: hypothetical protein RIR62_2702 [Pseudomonadota bacterium]|jgi:peptidoglycan/LPS O-acetylase OafA/YrhL